MTTASDSTYVETAVRCREMYDFISISDVEITIFLSLHLALVSSVPTGSNLQDFQTVQIMVKGRLVYRAKSCR